MELEHEAQRHLDLSRASDGLVRDTQTALAWADVEGCEVCVARIRRSGLADIGKADEVDVLAHAVDRDVEARSVGHVEDIDGKLHGRTLGYLGCLYERDVRAPLPRLPEDIALSMVDEVRLVGIIGGNRAIQSAWTQ